MSKNNYKSNASKNNSLDSPLLTVNEVSQILRMSVRSVWQRSSSGDIPKPVRLGPQIVRCRKTDLDTYIQELPTE